MEMEEKMKNRKTLVGHEFFGVGVALPL